MKRDHGEAMNLSAMPSSPNPTGGIDVLESTPASTDLKALTALTGTSLRHRPYNVHKARRRDTGDTLSTRQHEAGCVPQLCWTPENTVMRFSLKGRNMRGLFQ